MTETPSPSSGESKTEGTKQPVKLNAKKRMKLVWERNSLWLMMLLFFTLLVCVVFFNRIFHRIEAGEAGIMYRPFWGGTDMDTILGEGLQVTAPFDSLTKYNTRLQAVDNTFYVLSSNGLSITVTMSVRYRPIRENLPVLHQKVGPNYFEVIVLPEVQAIVRKVFGQYLPEEIYTSKKFIIQNAVQGALSEVGERFVFLDDLLITKITLPEVVNTAIEEKLRQEQIALQFNFLLEREAKEAMRKEIEAEGIRNFQQIISQGITENYLRFKGIEATLDLAKSPNSKVVVIGGGKDGMPIILDGTSKNESTSPPPPADKKPDEKAPGDTAPSNEKAAADYSRLDQKLEEIRRRLNP